MSRPEAPIIMTWQEGINTWYILEARDYWVVRYQKRPVNVKTVSLSGTTKYKHTGFASEGAARRKARDLNAIFMTTDFDYVRLGD